MTTTPVDHRSTGWTADDSTFGARLALIRQRMGWGNVKEAAVACGLPTESWRTWERDNVQPRRVVEIAALIAERTGCDYFWLLAGPRGAGSGASTRKPRRVRTDRPPGHPAVRTERPSQRRPARLSRLG